jgi:uncharacterized protein
MRPTITQNTSLAGVAVLCSSSDSQVYAQSLTADAIAQVLRCYQQHDKPVTPIHPALGEIEGLKAYKSLSDMPLTDPAAVGVSIITSPAVAVNVVREAAALGIKQLWLQPGAHNADVLAAAKDLNLQLIYGGPCLLMQLGYDDDWTPDEPRASL